MSAVLLRASRHVREERWPQRSNNADMSPTEAWQNATPIYGHGLDAHEVRYHGPTETVLLRKNFTLVTVLDAGSARPTVRNAIYHFADGQP